MTSSARSILALLAFSTALPHIASASYSWMPDRWLDEGGKRLQGSPEFFWDIELTRLAREYAEKDLPFKLKPADINNDGITDYASGNAQADITDFEDALKTQRLKPADPAAARTAHKAMRDWLSLGASGELPNTTEADSEFADYHKAAALYLQAKPAEAKALWAKLLQRRAEQRHYRSVWAAFMLGKCCLRDANTRAEAITWFEKCRQLAREGFADSDGLAADSYGWQARAEYDSGNHPASARHYLQQLALGDDSAISSLKLLVPDRDLLSLPPLGFATFPPPKEAPEYYEDNRTEAQLQEARQRASKQLAAAVQDPVLRQMITAHVLAASTAEFPTESSRLTAWLDLIEKAGLKQIEGAASLGWAAYTAGRFTDAAKWVKLDQPATPLGLWLQAKLALRNGTYAEATQLLTQVVQAVPGEEGIRHSSGYLPKGSASADLGAALLAQGKFTESLDAFLVGSCWADAAYVAEYLLPTAELRQYVNERATLTPEEHKLLDTIEREELGEEFDPVAVMKLDMKNRLRNLTGRKLIREGNDGEGRLLLQPSIRKTFDAYQALIATGDNAQKPSMERAKAMFEAARLLRDNGVSWRGLENDFFRALLGGYSTEDPEDFLRARLTGKTIIEPDESEPATSKKRYLSLFIPSNQMERKRVQQLAQEVPIRNYVRLAAAIAVKASTLLPDNTEETADVLNQAGRWIQDLDNPGADKIYIQIVKRCPKTKIGAAVIAKHWFIEPNGPWTSEPETPDAVDPSESNEPPLPEKNPTDEIR